MAYRGYNGYGGQLPNYGFFVDTSNFLPFTFLERVAPFLIYKDLYEKEEERLEKNADAFSSFTLPVDASDEYKKILDNYRQKLATASNDFYTNGLNGNTRKALGDVFRTGRTEIAPMLERYKEYLEAEKRVQQLGSDAIVGVSPNINDYLGGSSSEIKHLSRKQLVLDGAALATGLLEAYKGDPTFVLALKDLYLNLTYKNGLSPDALAELTTEDLINNATPEIMSAAMLLYDANNKNLESPLNKARKAIQDYFSGLDLAGYSDEKKNEVYQAWKTGFLGGIKNHDKVVLDQSFDILMRKEANTRAWRSENRALADWEQGQNDRKETYELDEEGNVLYTDTGMPKFKNTSKGNAARAEWIKKHIDGTVRQRGVSTNGGRTVTVSLSGNVLILTDEKTGDKVKITESNKDGAISGWTSPGEAKQLWDDFKTGSGSGETSEGDNDDLDRGGDKGVNG